MKPEVTIRIIRCFEGPRHERLEKIWDIIAEMLPDYLNFRVFANPGARLSHGECFNRMWMEEQEFDNKFVLFTEYDFLPYLTRERWWGVDEEGCLPTPHGSLCTAMLGVTYCKRSESTRRIYNFPRMAGGWFVLLDKEQCPQELNFLGDPDPCNQLPEQFDKCGLTCLTVPGKDCYPRHYGVQYPMGEHLFWSRHLHDDPKTRVSGFKLGDIQRKHDEAVDTWIRKRTSESFISKLEERFGSDILGSSSESIAKKGTYKKFSRK
jgi:hypothetical protein